MESIRKAVEGAGLAILLAGLLAACGGNAEEGAIDEAYDDSIPAAEQPVETDAPGEPAVPDAAVEEPTTQDPGSDPVLTDQSQAEARQRGLCEAQRASYPGEDYRVECTRAVTGDDRRDVWECACVWGG